MNKFFSNVVLISSTFIFVTSVGFALSYQSGNMPNLFSTITTGQRVIYKDESSMPKYASGTCRLDSECTPVGCSSEVCARDKNLITACAVKNDYPNKLFYKCGCVKNLCVWYRQSIFK